MNGTKVILLGISFALLGLTIASLNVIAITGGGLGVLLAIIGMFIKD